MNAQAETAELVDLGLSVKWANMTLGATSPEAYGDYFAWGETSPKSSYTWGTYKWNDGTEMNLTKYISDSASANVDYLTALEPTDDVARVILGGSWRMPTNMEWAELINNCTWTWDSQNNVFGYRVVGSNNKEIFLPASGLFVDSGISYKNSCGYYWSSNCSAGEPEDAWQLFFNAGTLLRGGGVRYQGHSVRPVSD